jgi:GxxExxY protein
MEYADLTEKILGAAFEVHRTLGPGYVEAIYQQALIHELGLRQLSTKTEVEFCIRYKDRLVGKHRLDIVVEDKIIIELKAVSAIIQVHIAQALSYLTGTGLPVALILNFGSASLSWKRLIKESAKSAKSAAKTTHKFE